MSSRILLRLAQSSDRRNCPRGAKSTPWDSLVCHWIGASLVCALLLAASLRAQVATGTIVGVVQDATGAVVPNAQVNVLHVATAESRQTRSNERGEFSLPYLRIGEYSVSAEAGGSP